MSTVMHVVMAPGELADAGGVDKAPCTRKACQIAPVLGNTLRISLKTLGYQKEKRGGA